MEQILDFKSEALGNFTLSDFNNIKKSGSVYINFDRDWAQINEGYFRFNRYDTKNNDVVKPITQILSQNLIKSNYLILKLSDNKGSMVSFFVNRNTVVLDEDNEIYYILITKPDFIGYNGMPVPNSQYTLSYVLNDPSKEKNVTKTVTTKKPMVDTANFSQDIKPTLPKVEAPPPKKYFPDTTIPVNVADYIRDGPKIYENEAYKNYNKAIQEERKEEGEPKICGVKQTTFITSIFVILLFYFLKRNKYW